MSNVEFGTPSRNGPVIGTIAGDGGSGKSSLAAMFPNPIFIQAEAGAKRISTKVPLPKVFRPIKDPEKGRDLTLSDLWDQCFFLEREDHDFKTVVFDSISKLDDLFIKAILANEDEGIGLNRAAGGYGNAPSVVAANHRRIRMFAEKFKNRGLNVIFIAHADQEDVRLPDKDDYQRYSLRIVKNKANSIAAYTDDVDFIAFVRMEIALKGKTGERKRAAISDDREIYCYSSAATIAKNPWGIVDALPYPEGTNPLAEFLTEAPKPKRKVKEPEPEPDIEAPEIEETE